MTQRDRDRLVVLKKAQKKLITQAQAAKEIGADDAAGAAVAAAARQRGRCGSGPRSARPAVEPPDQPRSARSDHRDSFARGVSRLSVRPWRASTCGASTG